MFEALPSWVSDVMLIVAFVLGPTGIIWSILNQKGANRKLIVEEGDLDLKEFSALTQTYKDLLELAHEATAKAVQATQEALKEVRESRVQREQLQTELDEVRDTQHRLRRLFTRVIAQYKIQLTEQEQSEFDNTHLRRRASVRKSE